MSHKSSQKRIEANRRNAQNSTGPRTLEGKAKSATNSTIHGFSSLKMNPLAPGCFLHTEDESQFRGLLSEYVATYKPQHPDELDLLTEAVFAKWRQQRIWLAEAGQIEIAIAQGESELRKSLPRVDAKAHLANGIAKSEAVLKLYLVTTPNSIAITAIASRICATYKPNASPRTNPILHPSRPPERPKRPRQSNPTSANQNRNLTNPPSPPNKPV